MMTNDSSYRRIFAFLLTLSLCISCKPVTKSRLSPVIQYDSNGVLRKHYYLNSENLKDSIYLEYYPNGQTKYSYYFKDGKAEGEQRQYYENNNVQAIGYYRNGILDSLQIEFYESGIKKSEVYRLAGEMFGVSRFYSENGYLESMYFMINDSTSVFTIEMSEDQTIKRISDKLTYPIYESDIIKTSDSAKVIFYTAIPDNYKYRAHLTIKNDQLTERKNVELEKINNNFAYFFYEQLNSGNNRIIFTIELLDMANNLVYTDSSFIDIAVK